VPVGLRKILPPNIQHEKMKELFVFCIFILYFGCPSVSSQKISCTDDKNTTLTMTLDCVFVGVGPVVITQKVLIQNNASESVYLNAAASIIVDGKMINESVFLEVAANSVVPHVWVVPPCGHSSLTKGSGSIFFDLFIQEIQCPFNMSNCTEKIMMIEDSTDITGPNTLLIPPNNTTGLVIPPSTTDLPFYAILNISSSYSNEAYRLVFELSSESIPFTHMYISAGTKCPDDGPYVLDADIDENPFTAQLGHVAPGLVWIKLEPTGPYNDSVTLTAQQKRIGPATCHKDTGMCENNRGEKILIIVTMSVCVGIAMVVSVIVAYKQRPKQKEPERFSLVTGQ